jgi:hypothetical protein
MESLSSYHIRCAGIIVSVSGLVKGPKAQSIPYVLIVYIHISQVSPGPPEAFVWRRAGNQSRGEAFSMGIVL